MSLNDKSKFDTCFEYMFMLRHMTYTQHHPKTPTLRRVCDIYLNCAKHLIVCVKF